MCGEAENLRRLTTLGRADRLKLTKTNALSMLRAQYRLPHLPSER
jgi:hypothetical protein